MPDFPFEGIAVAILISYFSIRFLQPFAKRLGLMDSPGGRKIHQLETPLIGGLAIFLGVVVSSFFLPVASSLYLGLMIGGAILIVVGALDDFFEVRPKNRLYAQIIAILCFIFLDHCSVDYLGKIFFISDLYLNKLSIPVTILLSVGYINAINMLDGQDGLAAGIIFTQALLLFAVSLYLQEFELACLLLVFLSLIFVFLCFNAPFPWRDHAIIFLGDAGSNFLGFFIAWSLIYLSQLGSSIKPVTLLWIVSLPFFDLISVCSIRRREGRSWFEPGHDHIHHLLRHKKISVFFSTVLLSLFSLSLGMIGLLLSWFKVSEGSQLLIFLMVLGAYLIMTTLLRNHIVKITYEEGLQSEKYASIKY